jgi:hypothetical protein
MFAEPALQRVADVRIGPVLRFVGYSGPFQQQGQAARRARRAAELSRNPNPSWRDSQAAERWRWVGRESWQRRADGNTASTDAMFAARRKLRCSLLQWCDLQLGCLCWTLRQKRRLREPLLLGRRWRLHFD